jgi:hypothetical protein
MFIRPPGHRGSKKEGKIMNIIDSATVSALLVVLALAVFAAVVTLGIALRVYVASRPARPAASRRPAVAVRLAH